MRRTFLRRSPGIWLCQGGKDFYYTERQYDSGSDDYGRYYYFYENDWELTFYKDGSELIFWDTRANTATVYLNELEY